MSTAEVLNDSYITEQEYLEGEKQSDSKHEYIDGHVVAMAGSSKRHNRIAGNIYRAVSGDEECDAYIGDIKVRIKSGISYYYPDVVVGCEESDNADDYYLERPCLIVEVLSSSTERKDGTEKLLAYQSLESLQAYMMVDQDKCNISMIYQQENRQWTIDYYTDMDDVILLACPVMELLVSDVYEAVQFDKDKELK